MFLVQLDFILSVIEPSSIDYDAVIELLEERNLQAASLKTCTAVVNFNIIHGIVGS